MEPIINGVNPLDIMKKSIKEAIMVGVDIPIQEAIQQHIELEKEKTSAKYIVLGCGGGANPLVAGKTCLSLKDTEEFKVMQSSFPNNSTSTLSYDTIGKYIDHIPIDKIQFEPEYNNRRERRKQERLNKKSKK